MSINFLNEPIPTTNQTRFTTDLKGSFLDKTYYTTRIVSTENKQKSIHSTFC